MKSRMYICIDLKSFFASVECVERGLDPMTADLVVADMSRTEKTICLAVTPHMKAMGVKNRCRVFEIPKGLEYIAATPRMLKYKEYSMKVYGVYLKYISPDDIHVYSIDEAFMDVTDYLGLYNMTAQQLGTRIMDDIYNTLGLYATCGVGTNMYLAKIALDITAKHSPDFMGVLDEESYQRTLWHHRPLTDFWRIGRGMAERLDRCGIHTMYDIAHTNEDYLYNLFGIDAELLIDHAYGREPVTIADVKAYRSETKSISSGQVLSRGYDFEEGILLIKEMTDNLCLDLVGMDMVTDSLTLHISYEKEYNLKPAHGTIAPVEPTSSDLLLIPKAEELYRRIVDSRYKVKRLNVCFNNVAPQEFYQYSFFVNSEEIVKNNRVRKAVLTIKDKYGKNAILKGMNFEEGSTMRERNSQIGGHRSGEETD